MKHHIKELNKNEINLICGNGAKESLLKLLEDDRFTSILKLIGSVLVPFIAAGVSVRIIRLLHTKEVSKIS